MKSHKGNSILLLFIPAFLFLWFFSFHSTYSGLFCTSGNREKNQELKSSRREEQGAQETAQGFEQSSGTDTPGALQSSFHALGFWKPLC